MGNTKTTIDTIIKEEIKEYLWFHLPINLREQLADYLKDGNHFNVDQSLIKNGDEGIFKIFPKFELTPGLIGPEYKFIDGTVHKLEQAEEGGQNA